MKILIFSLGEKGFKVVKALIESKKIKTISCVIGQDKGVDNDYSSTLIIFCQKHGVNYTFRKNTTYIEEDYDFFLAVGWRWIIRDISQKKLIVFHDSLLPKYRGFSPLVNALKKREKTTGVTALLGAEDYDKGNILMQKKMDITYPTHIKDEIKRISNVYANLAVDLFDSIINKRIDIHGFQQDENEATYSLWLDEGDYRINWSDDASNIEHFINCVGQPYMGAAAILNKTIVRIFEAKAIEDIKIENRSPGKVIFIQANYPVVVCGKGLLVLMDVKNDLGETILPLKLFRSKFQ